MTQHPHRKRRADACCATAMRKASRRLTQLYDDAIAGSGLKTTQYAILTELSERWDHRTSTVAQLAEALVMDRSSLSRSLKTLERDGFVVMTEGVEDHRKRHVALTKAGHAKRRQVEPLWRVAQNHFLSVFGEVEGAMLRSVLLDIANDAQLTEVRGAHSRQT